MRHIVQLTYVSEACAGFEEHEIPELLKSIRPANARHHITGMLLYIGGVFLQVLEGEATKVDALYGRILGDRRHRYVTPLIRQDVAGRDFADWTMDYTTVDALDAGKLVGDPLLFAAGGARGVAAEHARKLVSSFTRRSWQRASMERSNPKASSA